MTILTTRLCTIGLLTLLCSCVSPQPVPNQLFFQAKDGIPPEEDPVSFEKEFHPRTLVIHLQNGFSNFQVKIFINGLQVYDGIPNTNSSLGFAKSIRSLISPGKTWITVYFPHVKKSVSLSTDLQHGWLGISVDSNFGLVVSQRSTFKYYQEMTYY